MSNGYDDTTPQESPERDLVMRHVNELSEHFDNVHIFVSTHHGDKDRTRVINQGSGSWFARYGQIREWVIYEEENIRDFARKQNT